MSDTDEGGVANENSRLLVGDEEWASRGPQQLAGTRRSVDASMSHEGVINAGPTVEQEMDSINADVDPALSREDILRDRRAARGEGSRGNGHEQGQGGRRGGDNALDVDEAELRYGAQATMSLLIPVSICMLVVIAVVRTVSFYSTETTGSGFYYIVATENSGDSGAKKFGSALLNALVFIGVILAMTVLLVVLYKYRCYKIIHGWLILSSVLLLFFFGYVFLDAVFDKYNVPMDWITLAFVIWNFGVVGIICIHWKGPLRLQQVYLVAVSALLALTFIKNLPEWTTWVLLAAIAVYDLFAVLCPSGPLKMLVETAQERNEMLPALLYSSTVVWIVGMAAPGEEKAKEEEAEEDKPSPPARSASYDNMERSTDAEAPTPPPRGASTGQQQGEGEEDDDEREGIKLGLGDFIFYSILVGKAAFSQDLATTFACFIAILMGLCMTLLLLAIYRKALPALPISIACGMVFYFLTSILLVPMLERINVGQVFV